MIDMSKTILANVEGFTPVIDTVVDDLGLMSAVVFGRIWRYCQMEDQVCKASLETIADGIGVDRATVMRHAKELCEAGYLKDLTPELRNRPHVYADTGKAGLSVSISGVAQSKVKKTTVAESNTTVAENNVTVAESQLNKVFKKELKTPQGLSEKELSQANAKVTAIVENGRKAKYENRDKFPEPLLPFSDVYVELTGQKPSKRVLMDWIMAFNDWISEGLQPKDIQAAYKHATRPDGGFLVGRPGSLTNTAVALKSKSQSSAPALDTMSLERTRKMLEEKELNAVPRPAHLPSPEAIRAKLREAAQQKEVRR